jgi:hypothetical protein
VKAKIQEEEDPGPRSRPSLARHPVPDQLGASTTSSLQEGPPPTNLRLARQVSASHDKSLPRTRSLRLAQLSARSLRPARAPLDSGWGVGHGTQRVPGMRTRPPRRVGDRFSSPCNHTSWRSTQAVGPDRSLNAGLLSCTAIPSPSPPTLSHASFARGTRAPPTTSSGLRLGLNVAGYSSTRGGLDTNELLERGAKRPGVNSPARPRGSSHDQATQLHFNAS